MTHDEKQAWMRERQAEMAERTANRRLSRSAVLAANEAVMDKRRKSWPRCYTVRSRELRDEAIRQTGPQCRLSCELLEQAALFSTGWSTLQE